MPDDTKQTREVKAKRTAKNSVFLDLFQDKKNLLKLYKTLHPEDTEATDGVDIDIEVRAKVIYESDTEDIINQYIIFCKVFDEQRKLYGMTEQAVKETIRICKDRNILKEYLTSREVEVVTIMMSLFDNEQIMKTYLKDAANTAAHEADKATAERLIKKGKMSLEDIADCVPKLSFDELKELESEVMQLA